MVLFVLVAPNVVAPNPVCAVQVESQGVASDEAVDAERRIAYYQQRVAEHPRLYPAYALLGAAWFDKAQQSGDPDDLIQAREALQKSLDIQPSFEAYRVLAAVCNYRHRFAEAIRWGTLARDAYPADTSLLAMLVEAHLGLGQLAEAERLLSDRDSPTGDFYWAVAHASRLAATNEYSEASRVLLAAATLATEQSAVDLARWAQITAAGMLIDSQQYAAADPILQMVAPQKNHPLHRLLQIHQAELDEGLGRRADALAHYEALLAVGDDPEIRRRACMLARRMGNEALAARHFAVAEQLCRRVVAAGEVYRHETLVNLYCDAGCNLDAALRLAEENWQIKQDAAARQVLSRARASSAAETTNSAPPAGRACRRPCARRCRPGSH